MPLAGPDSLDAVLPLTLRDLRRARILMESLRVFFADLGVLWVVVPDAERSRIEAEIGFAKARVVGELELLPELALYRALYRATIVLRRRPAGWFVQQLLKLAVADRVGSACYLTLDADVVCLRPVRARELVVEGRALVQRHRSGLHREWYAWAERVLGLERSGFTHGVTPALFNAEGVRALQRHLAGRGSGVLAAVESRLVGADASASPWIGYLLRHTPWTEYGLYFTFLEATGQFDRWHRELSGRPIYDNSVWDKGAFEAWDPGPAFGPDGPYFCVVQSWLGVPPEAVWAKVGPHLLRAGARPPEGLSGPPKVG